MSVKTEVEVAVDGREGRLLGAHPLPPERVRVIPKRKKDELNLVRLPRAIRVGEPGWEAMR
jgi:hypothetical protein